MSNLRILYRNLADAATLAASPALVSTLPVANLQVTGRARVARTTSTADQAITGDWGSAQPVNGIVLWRHNLTETSTWRVRLYAGANQTGTLLYDSGGLAGEMMPLGDLRWGVDPLGATLQRGWSVAYQAVLWTPTVQARSFRIDLSDPDNPAGYLQVARLFIGAYWSPVQNADYGAAMAWTDDSELIRTDGGSLRTFIRAVSRQLSFSLSRMEEADRGAFVDLVREVGRVHEVFISLFPEAGGKLERDHQILGKITGNHNSVGRPVNLWADQITIAES
jgi:hypothetical protein